MISSLIRLDLRQLLREGTLAVTLALALTMVCYAVWSGARDQAAARAEFARAQAEASEALESELSRLAQLARGELSTPEAGAAGLPNAVKAEFLLPPGPLASLAQGESGLRPSKATVTAVSRASDLFRFYQVDNPAFLAQGHFDLAFVVVYLMPLLIIALGYGVLSADRESGSLGLLLSQPLTAARIAWVRILLRSGLVVATVIFASVFAWLLLAPERAFDGGILGRWGLWTLAVLAWGAAWAALTGFVVAANRSSDSNALVLLLAWALITLLLPSLLGVVLETASPTPSRMAWITAARAAENEANAQGGELVRGYLLDHPELEVAEESAVPAFVKTFVLVQRRVEAAVAPVTSEFERRLDQQQRLGAGLGVLSPASLLQDALTEIAGSSLTRHRRFAEEAVELRQCWLSELAGPILAGRRLEPDELAALPRPEFRETPLSQIARTAATPCLLLLCYAAIAVFLAQRRFLRFRLEASES